jgi:hypothetical protein
VSTLSSRLEAELLEEPAVAAGVVAGLEDLLDELLGLGLLAGVGHVDLAAELLGEVHVVAGGQEVLVVDDAEEDADLGAAGDGALAHAADDLLGVLLHAGNEGVAVRTLLALGIGVLDDDGLLAGVAARGQDHDLSGLEELHVTYRAVGEKRNSKGNRDLKHCRLNKRVCTIRIVRAEFSQGRYPSHELPTPSPST